jgi:hypothetical protein
MTLTRLGVALVLLALVTGCDGDEPTDGGTASPPDAGLDAGASAPDAGADDGGVDGGSSVDGGVDAGSVDAGSVDAGSDFPSLPVQCRVDADCPVFMSGDTPVPLTCDAVPRGRCSTLVADASCDGISCPAGSVCSLVEDVFLGRDLLFCEFLCDVPEDCGPGLICRDGTCDARSVCGDCTPYVCQMVGDTENCVRPSCAGGETCPAPLVCGEADVCVEP